MPTLASGFQNLPPTYQQLILQAQERFKVAITPLQKLVGGRSGAMIYLVSVLAQADGQIEHLILKLDQKNPKARADEIDRHNQAMAASPPDFVHNHMPEMAFERIELEDAVAIFFTIAGQSLLDFRPLTSFTRQRQLEQIFIATQETILERWNGRASFEQALHPQELLKRWLGFRTDPGAPVERFLSGNHRISATAEGYLVNGDVFPNPLAFARDRAFWGDVRPIDVLSGFQHSDLNTNNILVRFSRDEQFVNGYYLIDFALFKPSMPLFFDLRYLEMSYLVHIAQYVTFAQLVDFLQSDLDVTMLDQGSASAALAGVSAVIGVARHTFDIWAAMHHPSLRDDLWGQYWLAGVAAGLTFCHKTTLNEQERMAGFIFAASNLKQYEALFDLPLPQQVIRLFDRNRFEEVGERQPTRSASGKHPPHNLPAQFTSFIGRVKEVTAIQALLLREGVRLVTLTGPGGTGKTRLSLQVAEAVLDHFIDGVFFVSLAEIQGPEQVIPKIAKQLEVREGGSQPLIENLKDYLHDKSLLLLLDNFEQIIPAAPLVSELLAAAPGLNILITSRIKLNLRGEHEYPVPTLALPVATDRAPLAQLSEYEAIQLFSDRARAVNPAFILTPENAHYVEQICRRLDGLPLAIELAAARSRLLSPQAIMRRLDHRLGLLVGGAQDLPARQQTLRNTLDWSYELLDQPSRELFTRLGVFVDGFTLDAVEAVCNLDQTIDALQGIATLLDNSLLHQHEGLDGEIRFQMLETIREYALELLDGSGQVDAMRQAHARYFGDMVIQKAGLRLFSVDALQWMNWIDQEYGNIRATLTWSLADKEVAALGPLIASGLTWYWYRRGHFNEGRMWSQCLIDQAKSTHPTLERALVLQSNAMMAMWQADLKTALTYASESLVIQQHMEEPQSLATALMVMGIVHINMGKDQEAYPYLKESQAIFQELGNTYFDAVIHVHLGNVSLGLGNPAEAHDWLQQGLALGRQLGEEWVISFALNNLGEVARVQGDYQAARQYYLQCEQILRAMGDKGDLARIIHTLGYVAIHEGDLSLAEARFQESLAMFRKLGNQRGIAECLAGLAGIYTRQDEARTGASLLATAETLMKSSQAAWWPADRAEIDRTRQQIQQALDEGDFKTAWAEGQAARLEQVFSLVAQPAV
jgi:predicted ATPase